MRHVTSLSNRSPGTGVSRCGCHRCWRRSGETRCENTRLVAGMLMVACLVRLGGMETLVVLRIACDAAGRVPWKKNLN